jgi:hypothetical protein
MGALLFYKLYVGVECRSARLARVIFNNGSEFVGQEFQELLESYGIKPVPTTAKNPKSNGVIEGVHLTMGDMLRTMTFSGTDWFQDLQQTLDAVAWAVRTTINPNIKNSPCHLAFHHDMIFHQPIAVSWNNMPNAKSYCKHQTIKRINRLSLGNTHLETKY